MHGACGCWGVLASALLTTPPYALAVTGRASGGGLFFGGGNLLGAHCLFVLAEVCWVGSLSTAIFTLLHYLGLLRIPAAEESAVLASSTPPVSVSVEPAAAEAMDGSTHMGQMYAPGVSPKGGVGTGD